MVEEVLRSFTWVKVPILRCKNTQLQVKVLQKPCTNVPSAKCTWSIGSKRSCSTEKMFLNHKKKRLDSIHLSINKRHDNVWKKQSSATQFVFIFLFCFFSFKYWIILALWTLYLSAKNWKVQRGNHSIISKTWDKMHQLLYCTGLPVKKSGKHWFGFLITVFYQSILCVFNVKSYSDK